MFRLNRLTDYAVVVMAQLALRDKATMAAGELARDTGMPLPTVAKVLNALARDGLIVSQRGAAGGYGLGRPADEISVADVIQAIEGPIALTACVDGAADSCGVEALCPMHGNWNKVNSAIHKALNSVSLADMSSFPEPFGLPPGSEDGPREAVPLSKV